MKIRIIITMIYHSQSDSQSECINQTVEIVLQYVLKDVLNADFIDFLSTFKQVFNNSINAFIRQTSNEIIYEYNLMNFFGVITDEAAKEFKTEHKIHQQEAQNLIAWANLVMKNHYDRHHISLLLNSGDLVT